MCAVHRGCGRSADGGVLKIKELQRTKSELFESLELFYKVFYLGEDMDVTDD